MVDKTVMALLLHHIIELARYTSQGKTIIHSANTGQIKHIREFYPGEFLELVEELTSLEIALLNDAKDDKSHEQ
jgi:hypothetical protein